MLLQAVCNRVVHILIILKLGRENLGALLFATEQFLILTVVIVTSAANGTEAEEPEN